MCGLVGIRDFTDAPIKQHELTPMLDRVRHRGPDDMGLHIADGIALGHARLSILDLTQRAAQPMTSQCGRFTIAYNGEIYNFRCLRDELDRRGVTVTSRGRHVAKPQRRVLSHTADHQRQRPGAGRLRVLVQPLQPLLHEPYIEWGRSLSTSQRANRSRQMKAIHELAPELGAIAFAGRRRTTGKLSLGSFAYKLHRRLRNRRADPDLGAVSAVRALTRDESVVSSLRRLAERDEASLDAGYVERMIATPDRFEHELGTLISAAWATECAETIAGELSTARPVRRAA